MEKIHWHIITSENADEVFKKLEADGIDPVLFGLTDKDFEMLSKNFAKIIFDRPYFLIIIGFITFVKLSEDFRSL